MLLTGINGSEKSPNQIVDFYSQLCGAFNEILLKYHFETGSSGCCTVEKSRLPRNPALRMVAMGTLLIGMSAGQ